VKRPKHNTDWVLKYRKHLQSLARVRVAMFGSDATKLLEKIKDVLTSAIDDPTTANWDRVGEEWWNLQRDTEIAAARKEVAIQTRLAPLYEQLKTATSEEWEAYAKLVSKARFMDSPMVRAIAESNRHTIEILSGTPQSLEPPTPKEN
jgi:hypothetical protein